MTFAEMIEKMTPDIYNALKRGVELGKWPNGQELTAEQRSISMEAVLRYEVQNDIPAEQRVGYIAPKKKKASTSEAEPVRILDQG